MLTDTTPEAERVYHAILAKLTPGERAEIVLEMIAATDDLVRAGIRLRYPEATGEEFDYQFLRAKYGDDVAGRVYGRP